MKNVILSKKLTFSLTSLIVLLAFGVVCFAPSTALGHEEKLHPAKFEAYKHQTWWDGHKHPELTVTAVDVDPSDGPPATQLVSEHRSDSQVANADGSNVDLEFRISFSKAVNLDNTSVVEASTLKARAKSSTAAPSDFHILDVLVALYDKDFAPLGFVEWASGADGDHDLLTHASPGRLGQDFNLSIPTARIIQAGQAGQSLGETYVLPALAEEDSATADVNADKVRYLTISVRDASVRNADQADVLTAINDPVKILQYNILNAGQFELVRSDLGTPKVLRIQQRVPRSDFTAQTVTGPFDVEILLSEEPAAFTKDHLEVTNGTVTSIVKGIRKGLVDFLPLGDNRVIDADDANSDGNLTEERNIRSADFTGRGFMLSQEAIADIDPTEQTQLERRSAAKLLSYLVTITPDLKTKDDVVIKVKSFDGRNSKVELDKYIPPSTLIEGAHKLTVKVGSDKNKIVDLALPPGYVGLPDLGDDAKAEIPDKKFLVLAKGGDAGKSGIVNSPVKPADKVGLQEQYNIKYGFDFKQDLKTLFRNGGTIQVIGPASAKVGDLIISEVMWGTADDSIDNQWIELQNRSGANIDIEKATDATSQTKGDAWYLAFHPAGTPPALTTVTAKPTNDAQKKGLLAGSKVIDEVSNGQGTYWQVPGQSGIHTASVLTPTISNAVSMYRAIDASGAVQDGKLATSWIASPERDTTTGVSASTNITGRRVGTPGAANPVWTAPKDEPPKPTPKAPVAKASDLMISEIMVASNDGRLPQWIEIANVSGAAVGLMGWSLSVDNDPMDADVVAPSVNIELGDVTIGKDQVALVVTKAGRNSGVGTGKGDLRAERIVNVQSQVSKDSRYSLISEMAFRISLIPPLPSGVVDRGDVVGNLGMGWELPMSEDGRSSLIRREMGTTAEIMGTDAAGWVSADATSLVGAYTGTYYGDADDMGTPGYDKGGALPVELSKFNAKRDPLTGAVMITWETQSELNNAGFFIKRSQQKNGEFQVVNPTMIAGAGTISEKQSYTYTDTTAQPNIVYYYQIEDVSLDGQRQTLTRAHRLKGHVGAAGKATTTWGELKTSHTQ